MSGSGMNAQLGFVAETTYGTAVVVTKFLEFVSESLAADIERIESQGLRAGRRVQLSAQWAAGRSSAGGDIELELSNVGQGLLWLHAMGASGSSGGGPYIHTYTPADLQTLFMTMQVGKPFIGGTVQAFTYTGCTIAGWELSASAGEIATVTFNILAQAESTAIALATATYPATYAPMTFVHGVLSLGGSAVDVREVTISADNGLKDDRYFIKGSGLRSKPIEAAKREYTWSAEMDFADLTAYNRFKNGTEAALTLTFTNGANIFQVVGNVRTDGSTPTVGGPDILAQPLTGRFVASGATDDTALKIIRTTTEATATA
jgi:tail tube protein